MSVAVGPFRMPDRETRNNSITRSQKSRHALASHTRSCLLIYIRHSQRKSKSTRDLLPEKKFNDTKSRAVWSDFRKFPAAYTTPAGAHPLRVKRRNV